MYAPPAAAAPRALPSAAGDRHVEDPLQRDGRIGLEVERVALGPVAAGDRRRQRLGGGQGRRRAVASEGRVVGVDAELDAGRVVRRDGRPFGAEGRIGGHERSCRLDAGRGHGGRRFDGAGHEAVPRTGRHLRAELLVAADGYRLAVAEDGVAARVESHADERRLVVVGGAEAHDPDVIRGFGHHIGDIDRLEAAGSGGVDQGEQRRPADAAIEPQDEVILVATPWGRTLDHPLIVQYADEPLLQLVLGDGAVSQGQELEPIEVEFVGPDEQLAAIFPRSGTTPLVGDQAVRAWRSAVIRSARTASSHPGCGRAPPDSGGRPQAVTSRSASAGARRDCTIRRWHRRPPSRQPEPRFRAVVPQSGRGPVDGLARASAPGTAWMRRATRVRVVGCGA